MPYTTIQKKFSNKTGLFITTILEIVHQHTNYFIQNDQEIKTARTEALEARKCKLALQLITFKRKRGERERDGRKDRRNVHVHRSYIGIFAGHDMVVNSSNARAIISTIIS